MSLSILLLVIFCFLLISAAVSDIVGYTIPNWLNGAMFALFVIFVVTLSLEGHAIAWSALGLHLLGGSVALAAGITMLATGWVRPLAESKARIPHGVGLGLGALRALPDTDLFRLVVR